MFIIIEINPKATLDRIAQVGKALDTVKKTHIDVIKDIYKVGGKLKDSEIVNKD